MLDTFAAGLLFCRLLVATGFVSLAPSACFGGDTSAIGLDAIFLLVLTITLAAALGNRAVGSSSVVMIFVALSVLAVGSAAIVHLFNDYSVTN
jgi:hypothetical protein